MHGITWQPWARLGLADGCHVAVILTTTLSLMPIPAVASTKGQWDRITTVGECDSTLHQHNTAQSSLTGAQRQTTHHIFTSWLPVISRYLPGKLIFETPLSGRLNEVDQTEASHRNLCQIKSFSCVHVLVFIIISHIKLGILVFLTIAGRSDTF